MCMNWTRDIVVGVTRHTFHKWKPCGSYTHAYWIFSSLFPLDPDFRSSTKPLQKSPMTKRSRTPPPLASMPLSPSNPSLLPGNLRPSRATPESPRASLEAEKHQKEEKETGTEETQGRREEDKEAERQKKEQESDSPAKSEVEVSTRKAHESNG